MATITDTTHRLPITDVTDTDRAAALAETVRHELTATLTRSRDSCVYTAAEYRQLAWLLGKARVEIGQRAVTLTGPAGHVARRFAYVLYAVLERAANTLDTTPLGIPFEALEGEGLPNGGRLTWR